MFSPHFHTHTLGPPQTMYTLFGQFLIYLTPNQLLAMLLAAAFNQLWAIFK